MSYTPKPWFLYESEDAILILNVDSDVIAQIDLDTPEITDPVANARLIRSAPELLEELEALVAKHCPMDGEASKVRKLLARVRKGSET
jgi:hypothetical protein